MMLVTTVSSWLLWMFLSSQAFVHVCNHLCWYVHVCYLHLCAPDLLGYLLCLPVVCYAFLLPSMLSYMPPVMLTCHLLCLLLLVVLTYYLLCLPVMLNLLCLSVICCACCYLLCLPVIIIIIKLFAYQFLSWLSFLVYPDRSGWSKMLHGALSSRKPLVFRRDEPQPIHTNDMQWPKCLLGSWASHMEWWPSFRFAWSLT